MEFAGRLAGSGAAACFVGAGALGTVASAAVAALGANSGVPEDGAAAARIKAGKGGAGAEAKGAGSTVGVRVEVGADAVTTGVAPSGAGDKLRSVVGGVGNTSTAGEVSMSGNESLGTSKIGERRAENERAGPPDVRRTWEEVWPRVGAIGAKEDKGVADRD